MKKYHVIIPIMLILVLLGLTACSKPKPNPAVELATIQKLLDPSSQPNATLRISIEDVPFDEPIDRIRALLQPDSWEAIDLSADLEEAILSIHLGDSYTITAYDGCVKIYDGYASMDEVSHAYYSIPQSAADAVNAYHSSHEAEVIAAKYNPSLDPHTIQGLLTNGKTFQMNGYTVSGEDLADALAPDTWQQLSEGTLPRNEYVSATVSLGDDEYYYITVYESYLCIRDDLRIPLYKDHKAYYSIPKGTQESMNAFLETLRSK